MIKDVFKPVAMDEIMDLTKLSKDQFGKMFQINTRSLPNLKDVDIAIVGIKEERGCINNTGCINGPDAVRRSLYLLHNWSNGCRIVDMGDIVGEPNIESTYVTTASVINALLKLNIVPIIIGGGHDLALAQYNGYDNYVLKRNVVTIDEQVDMDDRERTINNQSFLSEIVKNKENNLTNYNHIGYQRYLTNADHINVITEKRFNHYRLGKVRENLEEAEPIIRDADMVSFDISAIKQADAPGIKNATPNGFSGEEACQIVRYAGLSDRLTSIGFYEMNPAYDINGQTAQLVAQMIWCFIDGYYGRKHDYPNLDSKNFIKYRIDLEGVGHQMVFLKSKKSDRWWIELPATENGEEVQYISCSYADYQRACKEEIPDKWLKAYSKVSL